MNGLVVAHRRPVVPQRAMQAILGITVTQWAGAMRAEGQVRRAAALETVPSLAAADGRRPVPHDARIARLVRVEPGGRRTPP